MSQPSVQVLPAEFEDYRGRRSLPVLRMACLLGSVAAIFFIPLDRVFHEEETADWLINFRLGYIVPVILMWLVLSFSEKWRRYLVNIMLVTGLPIGFSFTLASYESGVSSFYYASVALTQVCLFSSALFCFPTLYAGASSALIVAPYAWLVVNSDESFASQWLLLSPPISISILGTALTWRSEITEKTLMLTERKVRDLRNREQALERQRLEWLQSFSKFVRHESNNALIGIGTSLQLISMNDESGLHTTQIERASRSLEFVRRLLKRSIEANSVEGALVDQASNLLDITQVCTSLVEEYRSTFDSHQFNLQIEGSDVVSCNGDLLREALEKILTNAVEHTRAKDEIDVLVCVEPRRATISVINPGETLPDDKEQLFLPFSGTNKSNENFGLGLFVARTIVRKLGGDLTATNAEDVRGASFTMTVPDIATSSSEDNVGH